MKNQISDLKTQIKGGSQADQDLSKVVQELRLKLTDVEGRLVKAQQELQVSASSGISTKMSVTCCSKSHPLKQKS